MRRLFTLSLLALFGLAKIVAQDTGTGYVDDGYYRIRNYGTERYIYVTDNKDYYDITHDKEDFQAIQLWKNAEKAISDPASVIYIEKRTETTFDLKAQGTGVHSLTNYYVNVTRQRDGTYEVSATKTVGGTSVTKYLYDGKTSTTAQQGSLGTTGLDDNRKWIVDKIETDHSINYVGIKPTIEVGGLYYQPFYASFPFRAVSPDTHIYYISNVEGDLALLQEIEGDVPGGTPVIIECASANSSDNRIEVLISTSATITGNKLSGVYFCNGKRPKESVDAYKRFDAETMRLLSVSNGKLALTDTAPDNTIMVNNYTTYTQEPAVCLFANTSYYIADANTPSVIELTDDPTSIKNIAVKDKETVAEGVYSISGTKLRQTNDTQGLPVGLYIVGGKKIAIK